MTKKKEVESPIDSQFAKIATFLETQEHVIFAGAGRPLKNDYSNLITKLQGMTDVRPDHFSAEFLLQCRADLGLGKVNLQLNAHFAQIRQLFAGIDGAILALFNRADDGFVQIGGFKVFEAVSDYDHPMIKVAQLPDIKAAFVTYSPTFW